MAESKSAALPLGYAPTGGSLPPWRADHSGEAWTDQRPLTALPHGPLTAARRVIAILALPPVGTRNKSQSPRSRDFGRWLQHFCHSGCKNHSAPAFRIDMYKICSQSLIGRQQKPGPHMHKVKSLLLGTAAGSIAFGSAQAADLPAK